MNKRYLCIDHGLKYIGLALYDRELDLFWPLQELISSDKLIFEISEIIASHDASEIVVGWPVMLDGSEGEQCKVVQGFVAELSKICDKVIHKYDERFSNQIAESEYGFESHSLSAMIVLQSFINSQINIRNTQEKVH